MSLFVSCLNRIGVTGRANARRRYRSFLYLALTVIFTGACADERQRSRVTFAFRDNDVVVFTGGANVVAAQGNSYLETLLTLNLRPSGVRFRNMGWEGDTVYEQRRELNFGSWNEQFARVGATVIFVQFGQMESLRGIQSLPAFVAAYQKLLDEFARQTARLVLVSPFPFEKTEPPLPDLASQNDCLRQFVEAIREIARGRNYYFVDLFTPLPPRSLPGPAMTSDGLSLTPFGCWITASETIKQLGFDPTGKQQSFEPSDGTLSPSSAEQLRRLIVAKNRLWFEYWRPMNWAFLHGDRTEQPSSRDHRDRRIRWFPEELEKFIPLIEANEREIAAQSKTTR